MVKVGIVCCLKCSSCGGQWEYHTLQHAFNDLHFHLQHRLSLAVNSTPLEAYYFSIKVLVHKQQIMNMWYQGEPSNHNTGLWLPLFFDYVEGVASGGHSASTPFCSTITALNCSHFGTAHVSGRGHKESSPAAEFVVRQMAFVKCAHIQ